MLAVRGTSAKGAPFVAHCDFFIFVCFFNILCATLLHESAARQRQMERLLAPAKFCFPVRNALFTHGSAAVECAWEGGRSPGPDPEFPPEAPLEAPGSGASVQAWAAGAWAGRMETGAFRGLHQEDSQEAG
jgi:hypothetical protein